MRRGYLCLLVAALLPVAPTEQVKAQGAEDAFRFAERFPGTGAKQLGMAGLSRAGMADWTAVASNPAGLGWMKRGQILGSLNSWSTSDLSVYQGGGLANPFDTQSGYTRLGNAGYVYKHPVARGSMAFGLGYNQTGSFRRNMFFGGENGANSITDFFMPLPGEFDLVEDPGPDGEPSTGDEFITAEFSRPLSSIAYETFAIDLDAGLIEAGSDVPFLPAVTRGTVEQSGEVFEEGGTEEFTIAGAVEAARDVMIGFGLNFAHGNYRLTRHFDEFDFNDDNDGSGITTDFESLRLDESLYTNMWGINLRTGLSAALTPNLTMGLTVETPTEFSVEEDIVMDLSTLFDNGDTFRDRATVINDYNLLTPWRFGGGAALTLGILKVGADAEFVDWSQLRFKPKANGDFSFDDVNRTIRQEYQSTVNLNFGGELELGRLIVLRGGYALQPDPRETEAFDRSKEFYSAGIGFRFARTLEIDLGWTREQFDDRYQPYIEVQDAPVVFEEVKRDRVAVGIRFNL